MLFHANLGAVSGGFLGVDVFFVISGFLITTLLLREHASTGRIDLVAFWRRRARRLLPALFLLLAGVVVFAAVVVPDVLARLRVDVIAAMTYVTNWYLIFDHQSYFEAIGRPSLFRHLWSLAVEEQFYLAWPILLAVALALVRRRGALILTITVAAASIAWTAVLFDPEGDPSRVYYGTDTRLFALLIGAALAFVPVRLPSAARAMAPRRRLHWSDGLAIVGVVALVAAFVTVDQYDPALYPWGSVVLALIAAGTIFGAAHPGSVVASRMLDTPVLRWVGRRSYGIYLWHWPVVVLTRPGLDVPVTPIVDLALRVAITVSLAALSYRFVEEPIRRGRLAALWPRLRAVVRASGWGRAGLLASAASIAIAVALVSGRVIAAPPAVPPDIVPVSSFAGVLTASVSPLVAPVPSVEGVAIAEGPTARPTSGPSDSPLVAATSVGSSATPASAPGSGSPATSSATERPSTPPSTSVPASPTAATAAPPTATPAPPMATPAPTPAVTSAPTAAPTSPPAPRTAPPVIDARIFAIGDSVMLGAVVELGQALGKVEVDAEVGRQITTATRILTERRAAGRLPDVVIVHIGDNGPVTGAQVNALFDVLAAVPHVFALTVRIPDDFEMHNNRILTQVARDRSNVVLIDWRGATEGRSNLFWNDAEHLRPEGADVYSRLIASALRDHGIATR